MKNLWNFYKNGFLGLVILILFGHWLYQVIWAWERFWQGILVFVLLCLASPPWDRLEGYFSNYSTLKGKLYKDNSNIYKFSWFLCVISGFFAVTILMLMYWFDTTNEASYDSRYWIFVQLTDWLDIPYEGPHGFRYWIFTACIFFLFIFPTFRGAKELTPQAIDWLEYKAKERKKQEEADRKAKEAKLLAEKDREAKIEAERLALEEAEQVEIKRKREEEEAKKRAEQEKLQREIDAKKAQTKEMLESLKVEPLNKINKLTKKKEDLELLIDKEKNIINELSKKYSFLKKIVPDRFD